MTAHHVTAALLASVGALATAGPADQRFFDDFSYPAASALAQGGWVLRDGGGHPGVEGARWRADAIGIASDEAEAGNRLLQLEARTDGTGPGTVQAQLCHARKALGGTYAARVRFADVPAAGADGDPVVQTFYAVAPLRFDHDPLFSELDWEYLANGGWGSERTRLYAITWQTVKLDPWEAYNAPHEQFTALGGAWHTLVMQVAPAETRTRWYLDGKLLAEHGGRNHPVVPMAISFNLWFSPGGLLPPSATPRVWRQQVDWVFHARDALLAPAEVEAEVQALRRAGTARVDSVPPAEPPLASPCNF